MPIALIARTWIGKPIPSVVLGVAVAVRPESGDLPLRKRQRRGRVKTRLRLAGAPRSELDQATRLTGADEHMSPGLRRAVRRPPSSTLPVSRRKEVVERHVTDGVDVGVPVVVIVEADLGAAHGPRSDVDVDAVQHGHVMVGRLGHVGGDARRASSGW